MKLGRSLLPLILLYACSTSTTAGPLDELHILQAKKICKEKGEIWIKKPIAAYGYLRSKNISKTLNSAVSFYELAKELLEKRFSFFEMEQDYWTDPRTGRPQRVWNNQVFERAIGGGSKFYRVYLAPIDSPACAGFLEEIKTYQAQKLPYLRAHGLPLDLCIAAERTDEALSRYEINIEDSQESSFFGGFDWSHRWYARDRSNGEIIAEVTRNGYNARGTGPSFTCPNENQIRRFDAMAIRAIPDRRLAEPVIWSNVSPEPFAHLFELQSHLVSKHEENTKLSEHDFSSSLNPVADNGNISFRWDELNIINAGVGKRMKVHAFGRNWSQFQHLKLEHGEFMFFGERETPLHGKDAAIFRFRRDGTPLAAYHVTLPDMQLQGDVRHLVDRIVFTENSINLTVLDVAGAYGPKTVLTRYEVQAPIGENATSYEVRR